MILNNCQHVWRIVNDGIETVFIVCIRAIDILNETNTSINNFSNASILNNSLINSSFFKAPSPGMYPNISNSSGDIFVDAPSSDFSNIISPSSSIFQTSPSSISQPSSSIFQPSPSTISQPSPSNIIDVASPSSILNIDNSNISPIIDDKSFNITANFSHDNYTIPINIVNKTDVVGIVLGILIPLWFIFTSIIMYLYCKKRGDRTIMPCNMPDKKKNKRKKDIFTRPKDYFLEIIPNNDIPEIEKPPPRPPRPKLMMLTNSFDENDDKEKEVINVAYGITEKKNDE